MNQTLNRVRVMHVYKFLYDGGTERYIHTLISRMNPEKFTFSICCLVERGPKADMFENDGFKVHTLAVRPGRTLRIIFNNFGQILRLVRLFKRLQIQVVHTHDNYPAAFARVAAWLAGVPIVYVTYHNNYEWLKPIHHRINQVLALATTRIIAVSESVRRSSEAKDRIPDHKYRVIYNGVGVVPDASSVTWEKYRRELGLSQAGKIIGNVASLSWRKGQEILLLSFGQIASEFPDTYLVIVGSTRKDEPEIYSRLQSIASEYGVVDRVIFTGSRDDVLELIHVFDIYVMPSLIEGFGLSLVEAMCAGIPAITSDIDTFSEISCDGNYALMFESGNSDSLAEKIRFALNNENEMIKLGDEARRYAQDKFGIERMISEYEDLYLTDLISTGVIPPTVAR